MPLLNKVKKIPRTTLPIIAIAVIILGYAIYVGAHAGTQTNQQSQYNKTRTPQNTTDNLDTPAQPSASTVDQSRRSTPTPTTSSQTIPSSSTPSRSKYVAPVCTKTRIPYQTVYEPVSWLTIGETRTSSVAPKDGSIDSCTADSTGYKPSDITLNPVNVVIYQGTAPAATPTPPSGPSRDDLIAACIRQMQAISPNSSAYLQCYNNY